MVLLRLFGGVRLERDGVPITGRASHRHPLAILALLATAPAGSVGRDKLVALLWPDEASRKARHRLSVALHVLRKELGKDSIRSHGDALTLEHTIVDADVAAFEEAIRDGRLADAVDLYRGAFLDGFFLEGAAEFEAWADAERERMARLQAVALEQLAREAESRGERAVAARFWRRLGNHRPYSSRVAMDAARGMEAAGDRTGALRLLRAHITRLRAELGVDPDPELEALAERLAAVPDPPPVGPDDTGGPFAKEAGSAPSEAPPAAAGPRTRRREDGPGDEDGSRLAHVVPAAGLLATILVAGALVWESAGPAVEDSSGALDSTPSVAVQAFSASSDRRARRIVAGLPELVVKTLTGVPGLDVANSILEARAAGHSPPPTASDTADLVLGGRVTPSPKGFVVTAELLHRPSGEVRWKGRYELVDGDAEILQEIVSLEIAADVREHLPRPEPKEYTDSRTARDRYLEGRWAYRKWARLDSWKAVQLAAEALERDQDFALAHALSAQAYHVLARTDLNPRRMVEQARAHANRALELDSTLASGWVSLGSVQLWYDWDFAAAAQSLRRAIVLDPTWSQARAVYAGYLLRVLRRPDAALRQWRKGLELDPLNPRRSHNIERGLYFSRRYEEVIEQHRVTQALSNDLEWKPGAPLANSLLQLGRFDEAEAEFRRAQEWSGGPVDAGLGVLYARTGQREEALAVARAYEETKPGRHHLPAARVYAALGDKDRALALLEEAYEAGRSEVIHFSVDPALDPLRTHPRFRGLLRRIGLGD